MVNHIFLTWQAKKKVDFGYPFAGKDFRDLRNAARQFKAWGVKALWDEYLICADEYVVKSGYSVGLFCRCLVWLVDRPHWKGRAKKYEEELMGPVVEDVIKLLKGVGNEELSDRIGTPDHSG